jgi:hypothetical protein
VSSRIRGRIRSVSRWILNFQKTAAGLAATPEAARKRWRASQLRSGAFLSALYLREARARARYYWLVPRKFASENLLTGRAYRAYVTERRFAERAPAGSKNG